MHWIYSSVQTEAGNAAARFAGFPEAFISLKESIDGMVAVVCGTSLSIAHSYSAKKSLLD
jgi:hypothetical protein